jgi:uncharacterized protein YjcR
MFHINSTLEHRSLARQMRAEQVAFFVRQEDLGHSQLNAIADATNTLVRGAKQVHEEAAAEQRAWIHAHAEREAARAQELLEDTALSVRGRVERELQEVSSGMFDSRGP